MVATAYTILSFNEKDIDMSFKSMKRQQKSRKRNYLIFFSALHFLVWLTAYFLFGWLGIISCLLVNFAMDMGLLLIWRWGMVYKRRFLSGMSVIIHW